MAILGSTSLTGCDSIPSFIPAGTNMKFQQTAAPTSWTKGTTHNNKALRVVSGTGGGTGGSTAFTSVFASRPLSATVGSTTLDTTQIPSHTHTYTTRGNFENPGANPQGFWFGSVSTNTSTTGGGLGHSHPFSGTALDFAVQYVDIIICSKN